MTRSDGKAIEGGFSIGSGMNAEFVLKGYAAQMLSKQQNHVVIDQKSRRDRPVFSFPDPATILDNMPMSEAKEQKEDLMIRDLW